MKNKSISSNEKAPWAGSTCLDPAHPLHSPEHANLVHNMVPVPGRLQLLGEQPVQLLAHLDDALRHRPDVALPLAEHLVALALVVRVVAACTLQAQGEVLHGEHEPEALCKRRGIEDTADRINPLQAPLDLRRARVVHRCVDSHAAQDVAVAELSGIIEAL